MTEREFLNELDSALRRIALEERQDILSDYREHFTIGKEAGKTEEQIAAALGSPNKIAKELLALYHLEKAQTNHTTGNIFRAVWAAIGLGFLNLIIVLGPFMALLGVVFAGWISGVMFVLSPLLVLVSTVIYPDGSELSDLFISLTLSGIGLFIIIGMYYVTKILNKGFMRYLKFNISLVKGGLKHD